MIKLSLILLYGKLEISGVQNEQIIKIEVEYNAVVQESLAPFIRGLIKKTWEKNPANFPHPTGDAAFSSLGSICFSFYNGLNDEALQPDERVLGYVYQPEIRDSRLKIKKLFPQTVLTLTDQQLILLQQDLKFKKHYEWIFTFMPLCRITSIKLAEFMNWQKVSIHLLSGTQQQDIEVILEPAAAQKWRSIWIEDITANEQ